MTRIAFNSVRKLSESATTVFLSEPRRLQERDLSVGVQVLLVPAEDDDDVLTGQHPGVAQPRGQSVVRFPTAETDTSKQEKLQKRISDWVRSVLVPGDVVDEQRSCGSSVITSGHRPDRRRHTVSKQAVTPRLTEINR